MQNNVCQLYIKTPVSFALETAVTESFLPTEDEILSKKKSRRSALHHLPTTPINPQKPGKVSKTENNRQTLATFYQSELGRVCIYTPGTLLDLHHSKRKAYRIRTNGIVALTNFAKPVVTKNYDIGPGRVSFLYANETDITESALKMDILIFDILTKFEYLINQVKGRVKSKKCARGSIP